MPRFLWIPSPDQKLFGELLRLQSKKSSLGATAIEDQRFRARMHDLWDEHVALTRMVIISFAANLPDLSTISERLFQNQDAIAASLSPWASSALRAKVAGLLREHITGAVEFLKAAKSGNMTAIDAASAAWRKNGDQIADALAPLLRLPPGNVRNLFRRHLETTTTEALARLRGDWRSDLAAYDAARTHMLAFADLMVDRLTG